MSLHDERHVTDVYPELFERLPQQIWPDGQSVWSSHSIERPPTHESRPVGSHAKLSLPPLHEPQHTSVPAWQLVPGVVIPQ